MHLNNIKTRIAILLFVLASLVILIPSSFASVSFDDYQVKPLTSEPLALNEAPEMAVYQQNIHVVWNRWPYELQSDIYYRRSIDNGKTWENETILSNGTIKAIYPKIAVVNQTVHIVWLDYRDNNPEIYYMQSLDNGETWNQALRITYNNTRKHNVYDINLVVRELNIYLLWKEYRTGSSEIYYKKSNDNGKTWSNDVRLTADYNPSYYPDFEVLGIYQYVVFEDRGVDYNICLLTSNDAGEAWSAKTFVTSSTAASEKPSITAAEGSLYLTWQEKHSGFYQIFFRKSIDNGEAWGKIRQLSLDETNSINPRIYNYDKNLVVIWQQSVNETFHIYYSISNDTGETWSENKAIISNMSCYNHEIGGQGNNIHIVWQNYYQAAWSDIWYLGNETFDPIILSPVDSVIIQKESTGFNITNIMIFVIIFFVFLVFLIFYKRKWSRYNEK